MRRTLNIVGCGKVGQALGHLWASQQTFIVQDVLTRSRDSALQAIAFMGAGQAIGSYAELRPADVYLIGTPDDQIAACAQALAECGCLRPDDVVFHCSGALPAAVLEPVSLRGATIASIHPIRSFANPQQVVEHFAGTYCGVEGDQAALDILNEAFAAIGAQPVPIQAEFKNVYHAAAVFASNYLVTLLDVAVAAYVKAGMPQEVALALLEPLVRGTIDNVFRLGPTEALTGPIARGDIATVVRQYGAVKAWDQERAALYKQFAKLTTDVAAKKGRQT